MEGMIVVLQEQVCRNYSHQEVEEENDRAQGDKNEGQEVYRCPEVDEAETEE